MEVKLQPMMEKLETDLSLEDRIKKTIDPVLDLKEHSEIVSKLIPKKTEINLEPKKEERSSEKTDLKELA